MSNDLHALEYFVAGMPAGPLFEMTMQDLKRIVRSSKDEDYGNSVAELCLIGLVSHFESFCKNEFAAIINICPNLLENFCEKRSEVLIEVKDMITFDIYSKNKIGFLLSEKYDFGTGKKINSLFLDLLNITIFSKDEIKKYDMLLNDRNLLIHHGGIYTTKYSKNKFLKITNRNRVFIDSLIIKKRQFSSWAKFIESMANKIINESYKSLIDFVEHKKIKLYKQNKRALELLNFYEWPNEIATKYIKQYEKW